MLAGVAWKARCKQDDTTTDGCRSAAAAAGCRRFLALANDVDIGAKRLASGAATRHPNPPSMVILTVQIG